MLYDNINSGNPSLRFMAPPGGPGGGRGPGGPGGRGPGGPGRGPGGPGWGPGGPGGFGPGPGPRRGGPWGPPPPRRRRRGCYVATAVYGSYDCPQVWTLRRYRDDVLARSTGGRAFISVYYALSPTFVKIFGGFKPLMNVCRKILDKKVHGLNKQGFEDTPYQDPDY